MSYGANGNEGNVEGVDSLSSILDYYSVQRFVDCDGCGGSGERGLAATVAAAGRLDLTAVTPRVEYCDTVT